MLYSKTGEYANKKFEDVKRYLSLEISVLERLNNRLFYKFLEQFPTRVKMVVFDDKLGKKDFEKRDSIIKEISSIERELYLNRVANELEKRSLKHLKTNSFNDCLKKLSLEIRAEI